MSVQDIERLIAQRNHCVEVIANQDAELERLQGINAELIKALEEIANPDWEGASEYQSELARAAIAKAKEQGGASST